MRQKILTLAVVCAVMALLGGLFVRTAAADKNSPPDESLPEPPSIAATSDDSAAKTAAPKPVKSAGKKRPAKKKASPPAKKQQPAKEIAAAPTSADIAAEQAAKLNNSIRTGVSFINEGRYQMALNYFEGLTRDYPHSADAWYWIARACHALGNYDKAQAAVNIALEIDPYYGPLTKTPSGLEPTWPRSKQAKKEPRPSMSVLPVTQPLPLGAALEPVTLTFPYLVRSGDVGELDYAPYPPLPSGRVAAWMAASEKWNEIGRWRYRVDRMGILKEPRVPIAWKGNRPSEVYFWTGRQWARVRHEHLRERFDDILYRARGDLRDVLASEGLQWNESDTPSLAAAASLMRYMWVGDVDLDEIARKTAKPEN